VRRRGRDAIGRNALIASALLAAGCASTHYAQAPQPAVDLSGHWVLDPAASDDATALIAAALPKRAARPSTPPPPAPPARTDTGTRRQQQQRNEQSQAAQQPIDSAPSWGRVRPVDFVSAFAMPPAKIELQQQSTRVALGSDARRREFEPGDEEPRSVTDRYGSRKVHAGWVRDEFDVESDDGSRLKVVEHYRRHADDRLDVLVEFSAAGVKSLKVHSQYRRASAAEIAAADAEGPPAPTAR